MQARSGLRVPKADLAFGPGRRQRLPVGRVDDPPQEICARSWVLLRHLAGLDVDERECARKDQGRVPKAAPGDRHLAAIRANRGGVWADTRDQGNVAGASGDRVHGRIPEADGLVEGRGHDPRPVGREHEVAHTLRVPAVGPHQAPLLDVPELPILAHRRDQAQERAVGTEGDKPPEANVAESMVELESDELPVRFDINNMKERVTVRSVRVRDGHGQLVARTVEGPGPHIAQVPQLAPVGGFPQGGREFVLEGRRHELFDDPQESWPGVSGLVGPGPRSRFTTEGQEVAAVRAEFAHASAYGLREDGCAVRDLPHPQLETRGGQECAVRTETEPTARTQVELESAHVAKELARLDVEERDSAVRTPDGKTPPVLAQGRRGDAAPAVRVGEVHAAERLPRDDVPNRDPGITVRTSVSRTDSPWNGGRPARSS